MRTAPFALALVVPALLVGHLQHRPHFATTETARIRTHLAKVERALRVRDVSTLTPAQQTARARNLDVLHGYWTAGVFPKNTDFPDARMPYFIDRSGIRCAMAYLIEQSGHGDFVARVAATNNNARIRDLKSDPELVAWLDENGLTAAEAAHIQPEYQPPPSPRASDGYKNTTTAAVGLNAAALILNAAPMGLSRQTTGAVAVIAGLSGLAASGSNLGATGQRRDFGYLNAGVGALTTLVGVIRLTGPARPTSNAILSPWVGARGAPGLSLSVRF